MKTQLEFCPTEAIGNQTNFLRYPAHKVLAILNEASGVRSAINSLKAADFTDEEQEDLDIGLLLPCNVIVYESDKGSVVAAIDAKKMLSVAGNPQLASTSETVNGKLRSAIENL